MDPYLGEIRIFSFPKIPVGWASCNGQLLPVNQNQALYSLVGNVFGGNSTSFNLPDLRGRAMVSQGLAKSGTQYVRGINGAGGLQSVTLTSAQIPAHNHNLQAQNIVAGFNLNNTTPPEILAQPTITGLTLNAYSTVATTPIALMNDSIGMSGGNGAHENRVPLLALNICICISGNYPPRP